MKGLVIKDLYMAAKYCRSYLLITVVFCAASLFSEENSFFIFYPSILCGMIPVNLFAYDERSRWLQYSRTMPYTVGQIVSGKYVIGLMAQFAVLVLMGAARAIKMGIDGDFRWGGFISLMALLLSLSLTTSGLCLPFIFRFGVEKGRIAYYVVVGIACAVAVIFTKSFVSGETVDIKLEGALPIVCACIVGIVAYVTSWLLSVVLYKKREL